MSDIGSLKQALKEMRGLLDGYTCDGDVNTKDCFSNAVNIAIECIDEKIKRLPPNVLTCAGCRRKPDLDKEFFKMACEACIRKNNEQLKDQYEPSEANP